METYIGLLIIAGVVMVTVVFQKQHRTLDKERFERTNEAGVLEFASYEEKRAFDRREARHNVLSSLFALAGAGLLLFAVFLILAGSMGK